MTHIIPHSKPWIIEADYLAVKDVLSSGMVTQGKAVSIFEKDISSRTHLNNIVTCTFVCVFSQ